MDVKVRFNTNYPVNSDKKWRVIIDDVQHLVDEVELFAISYTSEDKVKDEEGNEIIKYHISATAKDVVFDTIQGSLIATII